MQQLARRCRALAHADTARRERWMGLYIIDEVTPAHQREERVRFDGPAGPVFISATELWQLDVASAVHQKLSGRRCHGQRTSSVSP
eukprot:7664153-Pyramimonas_sp.AAC.1